MKLSALSGTAETTDANTDPWVMILPSSVESNNVSDRTPMDSGSVRQGRRDVAENNSRKDAPSLTNNDDVGTISSGQIDRYRTEISQDTPARVAQNALAGSSVWRVTRCHAIVQDGSLSPYFSINLDQGGMPVTDQKDSGRCWLFGTLNLFRFGTRAKLQTVDFEFSESYLYFFHLLEQVNSFCENILASADRRVSDRLVQYFLDEPVDDGGDWGIAVNLLNKYGILPKAFFPETHSSRNTTSLLTVLAALLRPTALRIRNAVNQEGQSADEIRNTIKADCVKAAYRVLCLHLGTPPDSFRWEWRDADGSFHRDGKITPLEFMAKYVTVPFNDYVSVIQDPRNPYYRRYVNSYDMPIHGAPSIKFLNLPINELKSAAVQQLKDGLPVLFACNVEVEEDDEDGLWDAELYEWSQFYHLPFDGMSKKDRIEYGGTMGDHIMLFTGVDLDESTGEPVRWRVENSWGTDGSGQDGYYTMNDNWFDENVFEIATPPTYLSSEAIGGLDTEPIELPPWDPLQRRHRRRKRLRL